MINKMARYPDGTCFEKKEKTKNKDDKNHNFFLFFIKDNIKKEIDNSENIVAWWSMKGVPVWGYASIEILRE